MSDLPQDDDGRIEIKDFIEESIYSPEVFDVRTMLGLPPIVHWKQIHLTIIVLLRPKTATTMVSYRRES